MKDVANPPDDDALRFVYYSGGRWTVATYETPHIDCYGKRGIQVRIWEHSVLVYDTGSGRAGLVYVSPCDSIDSDRAIFSAVSLVCHVCGEEDATWDYEGLEECNSLAEALAESEDEDEDEEDEP